MTHTTATLLSYAICIVLTALIVGIYVWIKRAPDYSKLVIEERERLERRAKNAEESEGFTREVMRDQWRINDGLRRELAEAEAALARVEAEIVSTLSEIEGNGAPRNIAEFLERGERRRNAAEEAQLAREITKLTSHLNDLKEAHTNTALMPEGDDQLTALCETIEAEPAPDLMEKYRAADLDCRLRMVADTYEEDFPGIIREALETLEANRQVKIRETRDQVVGELTGIFSQAGVNLSEKLERGEDAK